MKHKRNYWDISNCVADALSYKTRSQWAKLSNSAYESARKNKWLDKCCQHMPILGSYHRRMIYSFEFPDNYVYVGLTYNPELRCYNHLNDANSQVFKHKYKTGLQAKFKYITKFLIKEIASEKEIIEDYRNKGWNILNKNKAGVLGGGYLSKWNATKCIEDAINYKTKTEWRNNSNGAYQAARKYGWFNRCIKHMMTISKPKNYWNKNCCITDSKKYKTKSEWRKNSSGAYDAALNNEWYKECVKHMIRPKSHKLKWSLELCKIEASMFFTKNEWKMGSNSSYQAAQSRGWIEFCSQHMKKNI